MTEPLLRDTERAQLAEALALARAIGRDAVRFIVRLLPALIRITCVTLCGAGIFYGTLDAWAAFGGDAAALLPTVALGLLPLLYAISNGIRWGGIVMAGAFTLATAKALSFVPFPFNQISIVIVLATLTLSGMARRNIGENQNEHP